MPDKNTESSEMYFNSKDSSGVVDPIDLAELFLVQNFEKADAPVEDFFTDGMYVRKITMYKGTKVVSKVHGTCHPFFILEGDVSVFSENEGEVRYKAPMWGITKPGTRRMLIIHEDTIWLTCHATQKTDVAEIEKDIIIPHLNPALAHERLLQLLTA